MYYSLNDDKNSNYKDLYYKNYKPQYNDSIDNYKSNYQKEVKVRFEDKYNTINNEQNKLNDEAKLNQNINNFYEVDNNNDIDIKYKSMLDNDKFKSNLNNFYNIDNPIMKKSEPKKHKIIYGYNILTNSQNKLWETDEDKFNKLVKKDPFKDKINGMDLKEKAKLFYGIEDEYRKPDYNKINKENNENIPCYLIRE